MFFAARLAERVAPEAAPPAPRPGRRYACALGADGDGFPPGGGGGVGIRRELEGRPRHPRACDRLGPHHARSHDHGMGGRACRSPTPSGSRRSASTRARWRGRSIQTFLRHALRDGFFHADMHQGNFFVDAGGPHRRGRFRHHGPPWPQGAPLPGRDPVRLHPPRLSPGRGSPFRGRLRARHPPRRGLRPGDPGDRRADPFAHRRPDLDGEAADAAVRGDGAVRHVRRGSNW